MLSSYSRFLILFATVFFFKSLSHGQNAQALFENTQQFNQQPIPFSQAPQPGDSLPAGGAVSKNMQSDFGVQMLLKSEEKPQYFTAFTESSIFATDNVAFSHKNRQSDTFLVASTGFNFQRALSPQLQVDATIRGSLFRYCDFGALDFQSFDTGGGIVWSPQQLGLSLYGRYGFTKLYAAHSGDDFYTNHAITLGAQKSYSYSRSLSFAAGTSALWNFTDPAAAQRNEYSAYLACHAQLARKLTADLVYRLSWLEYHEDRSREDWRQSITLALRSNIKDWCAVSLIGFASFNDSNQNAFDYQVANVGASVGLEMKF